jgi:ATP-dependent DNA helicase RecG
MTKESQNIDWKQSWHDDYLKWICGFANAQGGRIFIGYIDSWGRGIEKITDACKQAGLPEPIIDENSGGIAIELLKAPASKELGNRLGNRLGNTKERILAEMKANPKISGTQLAELLDISTTAVEKNIKQLREDGLINRVGGTRGHWELKE